MKPIHPLLLLALFAAVHPAAAQGRIAVGATVTGELSAADPATPDGAHHDDWTFEAGLGEPYRVTLRSDDFDAYLRVGARGRDGCAPCERDDDSGGGTDAMVEMRAGVDGTHVIRVTSYRAGQTGRYTLRLEHHDPYGGAAADTAVSAWTVTGDTTLVAALPADTAMYEPVTVDTAVAPWTVTGDTLAVPFVVPVADTGAYDPGDAALDSLVVLPYSPEPRYLDARVPEEGVLDDRSAAGEDGAYHDVWLYSGRRGQIITFALQSDEFDTVLRVRRFSPEDRRMVLVGSDDDGGTGTNSELHLTLPDHGVYEIHAGAYRPGATGRYTLTTTIHDAGEEITVLPRLILPGPGESSELTKFHPRGDNGAPMETWVFGGEAGWRVTIEMRSDDFDTVLRVLEEEDGVAAGSSPGMTTEAAAPTAAW